MSCVSADAKQRFDDTGVMVLPGVIPADDVTMLREECAYFLGYADARMDLEGRPFNPITVRGRRYFVNGLHRYSDRLWRFLFGGVMADVCRAALGDDAVLFNEQWVVKGADEGMAFSWHQDSGYVKARDPETTNPPYLTCWCTLDDVSVVNGTVHVLGLDEGGTRDTIVTHGHDRETNDLIGYTGDLAGAAIEAPAGSVIAFSSYNLHRSGTNSTDAMRRVYLAQYAAAPIVHSRTGEQFNLAVPFLRDGEVVYDRAGDTAANWGGIDAPSSN